MLLLGGADCAEGEGQEGVLEEGRERLFRSGVLLVSPR